MPAQTKTGSTVKANHTYLSDGAKASVLNASGVGYDYNGAVTYSHSSSGSRTLESVAFSGGRIRKSGSSYYVDYYVTDHLGIAYDDFGARLYDRTAWIAIDPLAEKYYGISTYSYCAGNPVRFVDLDGKSTRVRLLDDGTYQI